MVACKQPNSQFGNQAQPLWLTRQGFSSTFGRLGHGSHFGLGVSASFITAALFFTGLSSHAQLANPQSQGSNISHEDKRTGLLPEEHRTTAVDTSTENSSTTREAPVFINSVSDSEPLAEYDARLSTMEKMRVRAFRFEGNTVFSEQELRDQIPNNYLHRDLSAEDREEARQLLTKFYIERGFINSGALLNDQIIHDGVLTFSLVEGKLTEIFFQNNRYLRSKYLVDQLKRASGPPFNLKQMERALESLKQYSNLRLLQADLQPTQNSGEAILKVRIEENIPYGLALEFDNHRPVSVGSERLRLVTTHRNLTGQDDTLDIRVGLNRDGLHFNTPTNPRDLALTYSSPPLGSTWGAKSRLIASYSQSDTAVVQEPFRTLNISSRSDNASLGVRHQLRRSLAYDEGLSMAIEHRQSRTFLGGVPFSFSPGDVNGKAQTTALRVGYDFLHRNQQSVMATRALLSYGSNFPGSTRTAKAPNGQFLSLLAQAQYVRFLGKSQNQWLLRFNGQWANRPLLSVEQFAVGGADSVRGYLENQLVRDQGIVASTELRLPVRADQSGRASLTIVPFADFGYATNRQKMTPSLPPGTPAPNFVSSIGLGCLYAPNRRLNAQVFYGFKLKNFKTSGSDLQNKGVHFAVSWNFP